MGETVLTLKYKRGVFKCEYIGKKSIIRWFLFHAEELNSKIPLI